MEYQSFDSGILIKLQPDEEIVSSIEWIAKKEKIAGGWIQGIGGVKKAEIGFFVRSQKDYTRKIYEEDLELAQLAGTLSWNGETPFLHLHATFANQTNRAIAGHLFSAVISVTAEIWISLTPKKVYRSFDSRAELFLLDLKKESF